MLHFLGAAVFTAETDWIDKANFQITKYNMI